MAGTPPSTQQTHRRLLDGQLNAALLEFAPRYMKTHLEHLAHECDQRLERQLLPRLRAVLREIDQERDAFEEQKRDVVGNLRDHLNLLRFGAAAVDEAVSQLDTVTPRYLALLPTASSLTPPSTAPHPTPSTVAPPDGAHCLPNAYTDGQTAAPSIPMPGTSNCAAQDSMPQAEPRTPLTKPPSLENQPHSRITTESSAVASRPKRSQVDRRIDGEASPKRQRTASEKAPEAVQSQIDRRVAFPNLMTGECIFRHADRKGFFVVRCDFCESGFFTEPPLLYNRALKHFRKHEEVTTSGEELTNEFVFDRFASQVVGDEMASKYWIKEHLGEMPHTFVPTTFSGDTSRADDYEDMARKHQEIEDAFSPPFLKLRESPRSRQSDRETDYEKPRRARRNVPRPDYAEMVANKEFWNSIEVETEAVNTARPTASHKRRVTKPGVSSAAKAAESKKPFGYMSEPWPRRSAPR